MRRQEQRRNADRMARIERRALRRSIGMVTDDSPFTVELEGEPVEDLAYLASYTPTIGDKVLILRCGRDFVVLGEIV